MRKQHFTQQRVKIVNSEGDKDTAEQIAHGHVTCFMRDYGSLWVDVPILRIINLRLGSEAGEKFAVYPCLTYS